MQKILETASKVGSREAAVSDRRRLALLFGTSFPPVPARKLFSGRPSASNSRVPLGSNEARLRGARRHGWGHGLGQYCFGDDASGPSANFDW